MEADSSLSGKDVEVAVVDIKAPEFITSRPEFWFILVENSFEKYKINKNNAIFCDALAALHPSVVLRLSEKDLLCNSYELYPIEALGVLIDSLTTLISSGTVSAIGGGSPKNDRVERASLILTPFSPSQRPVVCQTHTFFGEQVRTWCQWPSKTGVDVFNPFIHRLLKEFPGLVSLKQVCRPTKFPSEINHSIDTGDSAPSAARVRKLSPEK
ncbi:unnamed protein product [Lepeophtheirus salmonis]|uniref:(salmon louse) hypothetical protein n=1 Tax=Lepeophtheirus salmonis TaxID=72036 RepID=A0A817FES7_LEPSM|nr:unnamed protein product [Lepeophtheirus salmonis]CAG9477391.1 unnamed protein product [Lepeophtheirus salmonis]